MVHVLLRRTGTLAVGALCLALSPLAPQVSAHGAGQTRGAVVFWNSFDKAASLPVTSVATTGDQFSGAVGASRLAVEHTLVSTPPNALAVTVDGGGSAYLYKTYATGYTSHDLRFHLYVGHDYYIEGSYLVLARTGPTTSSSTRAGQVIVVLGKKNNLYLSYWDVQGTKHYLWSKARLTPGGWHTIEVNEQVSQTAGSLAFTVDGTPLASATGLKLGASPVTYFALGDRYTPRSTHTTGHLYFDDVAVRS